MTELQNKENTHNALNQFVDFWQGRYADKITPWDLGTHSPHCDHIFEQFTSETSLLASPETQPKMVVPGSGRSHDAAFFAQKGFDVIGIDFAPLAITETQRIYGNIETLAMLEADFLHMPTTHPELNKTVDVILEHTCYCAINPKQRDAYKASALHLLKSGGYLAGIYWEHGDDDGPPFSTPQTNLKQRFSDTFDIMYLETMPKTAGGRGGKEHVGLFQKR